MGNTIHTKGILLDERDLLGPQHADLESLSATLLDHLQDMFEPAGDLDSGYPILEIFGFASERLATTHFYDDPRWFAHKLNWLKTDGDVRSALMKEIRHLDLPDPDAVLREDTEALQSIERTFQQKICTHVSDGHYPAADALISTLREIMEGIPGLSPANHLDWSDEEAIYDFRPASRGAGTRILAEIGFNWGQ